jgi:hypothetical protein
MASHEIINSIFRKDINLFEHECEILNGEII